ncbi:MAG TPA: hypothetical protein VNF06_00465, partial [Candidatus Aquilonibacter sp.]|nr:hypothetical protein [Candidatus Aquilonibacter sp.]
MLNNNEKMIIAQLILVNKSISADELAQIMHISKDTLFSAAENLSTLGYVQIKRSIQKQAGLTDEGAKYAASGLPEMRLIKRLSEKSIKIQELTDPESRIGIQWGKSKGLLTIDGGMVNLTESGKEAIGSGIPEGKVLAEIKKNPELSPNFESKH